MTLAAKIKEGKVKVHGTNQVENHQQSSDPFQYNPTKIQKVQSYRGVKGNKGYHSNTPVASSPQNHIQQYVGHPKEETNLRKNGPIRNDKNTYSSLPLRNHQEPIPRRDYQNVPAPRTTYIDESFPEQQNNQKSHQRYLGIPDQQKPQHKLQNSRNSQGSRDVLQNRHDIYEPNYNFHDQDHHDYHDNHDNHDHHDHQGNDRQSQRNRPNHQQPINRFDNNDSFGRYDDDRSPNVKTYFRGPFDSDFGSINRPSASESSTNPHSGGNGARHPNSGGHGSFQEPQKGCKFVEKEVKDLPEEGNKNNDGKSFSSKRYMMVKECFYGNDQPFESDQKPRSTGRHQNKGSESRDHTSSPFEYSFNDDDFFKDYFSDDEENGRFNREYSQDHYLVRPYRY